MYNELAIYFEDIFSDYQFGFRKGISVQQCLIILIETWKKHIDNKESFGALLTDLSKAFDCVNHELLIAVRYIHGYMKSSVIELRIRTSEPSQENAVPLTTTDYPDNTEYYWLHCVVKVVL